MRNKFEYTIVYDIRKILWGVDKMDEFIILVNEDDEIIGYGEKLDVHIKEQLHRAFSVFIFNLETQKMLIQKRADGKYHSGGKWSNACCSHPRKGEVMEEALARRLQEELGFAMPERLNIYDDLECQKTVDTESIIEAGHFTYYAKFDGLAEHEIDHVFVYYPTEEQLKDMQCNPEEISECLWITLEELQSWMDKKPYDFSAWFKSAFEIAYNVLLKKGFN